MKDKVIKDAMSSIENKIRHVYNQGLEDGLNDGLHDSIIINKDVYGQGYEKGSQDAWECARKIYTDLPIDKCIEIFEGKSWFDYTASEVIELLKDYCEGCRYWDEESKRGCKSPCIEKIEYEEKQKQNEKSCKNCGNNDCRWCINIATGDLTKWTPIIEEQDDEEEYDSETMCGQLYDNDNGLKEQMKSSDNKEDETYVYLYNGTFSKVKKRNSVILSTDITYWDHNIHDDKVLKAGEIHTLKEYFPETGACLITVNNLMNKDRCENCPNDHKCRLCLTGNNWDKLK